MDRIAHCCYNDYAGVEGRREGGRGRSASTSVGDVGWRQRCRRQSYSREGIEGRRVGGDGVDGWRWRRKTDVSSTRLEERGRGGGARAEEGDGGYARVCSAAGNNMFPAAGPSYFLMPAILTTLPASSPNCRWCGRQASLPTNHGSRSHEVASHVGTP